MAAMTSAYRFGNRYNYPDADIAAEIAAHHGVRPENVILGAGSSEILQVAGRTFLPGDEKSSASNRPSRTSTNTPRVSAPSRSSCRSAATTRRTSTQWCAPLAITIAALASSTSARPTIPPASSSTAPRSGGCSTASRRDVPVLIDEAYHHYVEDPGYATSIPYVLEGRNVVVTRTFSKIYGLAGMRLGYGIAPVALVDRMRPHCSGSINALVKWAGAAALKDTASAERVRSVTLQLRKKTTAELEKLGYKVLPSGRELLHGSPAPRRDAGDRGISDEGRAGRPSVSADGATSPSFGRHGRRDGPIPDGVP